MKEENLKKVLSQISDNLDALKDAIEYHEHDSNGNVTSQQNVVRTEYKHGGSVSFRDVDVMLEDIEEEENPTEKKEE